VRTSRALPKGLGLLIMRLIRTCFVAVAFLALATGKASAEAITVDQILFDSSGITDVNLLSGDVDMVLNGNVLQITLTNTSGDAAGDGAAILLTGIGFELPDGVSIDSGSVLIASGSTGVSFSGSGGTNVSQEWGYDNDPLASGAFQGLPNVLSYNTVASSMESNSEAQFAAGSIAPPGNLNGPDFGLVSDSETGGLGSGVEAINDSVVIYLTLDGTLPADLIDFIENGNVGLSFGSPNTVAEPTTLALLIPGVVGVFLTRRRKTNLR
jgi:hypothetical protein